MAQSVEELAREHVRQGLEAQKSRRKKKRGSRQSETRGKTEPKSRARRSPRAAAPQPAALPGADAANEPGEPEPQPERLFGDDFRLDVALGGGVRGWYPDQYPRVGVAHAGYFTWSASVRAKIFGWLRLNRGYYESTGLAGPRTQGAVVATEVGKILPKAAWLLGSFGVPMSRAWETLVSYETRSFVTRAMPRAPVAVADRELPRGTDLSQLPRSEQPLRFVSGFETLVLGVTVRPSKLDPGLGVSGLPPMYLGVGFTQYSKPYQLRVGQDALDEVLFDARFRGLGLAYGLTTTREVARAYADLDVQLGAGEVTLLNGLTVNQLLPSDWLIGYLQGQLKVGYILPLRRRAPALLLSLDGSAGGATFFYWEASGSDGGDPLPLNWDFLWGARATLSMPL